MSVYIKGFKYPENCWQCPMVGGYELSDEVKARYSTLHCRLLKCKTPSGVKPNDCPLVPVPPHGRLIEEADAVETAWMILRGLGYRKEENPQLEQTVREVFATAPTIEVE